MATVPGTFETFAQNIAQNRCNDAWDDYYRPEGEVRVRVADRDSVRKFLCNAVGPSSRGQRLAEGLVTLKEPVRDMSLLKQRPVINLLHSPRLAAGKQDKPAVHELVENVPHDVKIEQAWIGEGLLTLPACRGEEISDLAPVRSGMGIRASMAYVVDDLKTLKDLRK